MVNKLDDRSSSLSQTEKPVSLAKSTTVHRKDSTHNLHEVQEAERVTNAARSTLENNFKTENLFEQFHNTFKEIGGNLKHVFAQAGMLFKKAIAETFDANGRLDADITHWQQKREEAQIAATLADLGRKKRVPVEQIIKNHGHGVLDPSYFSKKIDGFKNKSLQNEAKKRLTALHLNLLGHQFSIGGEVKIRRKNTGSLITRLKKVFFNKESESTVSLEGAYRCIAHAKITDSLANFSQSNLQGVTNDIATNTQECFESSLKTTIKSISDYKKMPLSEKKVFKEEVQEILERYHQGKPVTIGTGWEDHSVEITLYKGMLCYSNRGYMGDAARSGMIFYAVPEGKVDKHFIKNLLLTYLGVGTEQQREEFNQGRIHYFESEMIKELALTEISFFEMTSQKVGNCSFFQAKCGIRALFYMLFLEKNLQKNGIEMTDYIKFNTGSTSNIKDEEIKLVKSIEDKTETESKTLFKQWSLFNKKEQFLFFIDFVRDINKNNEVMRRQEEYKLMSKVMYKFSNEKNGRFYQKQYSMHIEELMEAVKEKEYPLSECFQAVPMNTASKKKKDPAQVVERMLNKRTEGAFVLYHVEKEAYVGLKGKNGVVVHHKLVQEKNGTYHLEGNTALIHNLTDLLNTDLLNLEGDHFKYPVWPRGINS